MTDTAPRPTLLLASTLQNRVLSECESSYPEEACGILLGRRNGTAVFQIVDIVKSRNVSEERRVDRYIVDPSNQAEAELKARAMGLEVIGFYHSHPDVAAIPSVYDREQAWPDYIYVICEIRRGKAHDIRGYILDEAQQDFVTLDLQRTDETE